MPLGQNFYKLLFLLSLRDPEKSVENVKKNKKFKKNGGVSFSVLNA
jgi:hypothetical protein